MSVKLFLIHGDDIVVVSVNPLKLKQKNKIKTDELQVTTATRGVVGCIQQLLLINSKTEFFKCV